MRNLKRALSLTLASVMLLGMMVVGSSAAGYGDVAETDNVEAIEVIQSVGVMVGDENGNFRPSDSVNRAEMAVVMGKLLNLDYNYYEATCPFTDVDGNWAWARGWVGACYANGIVSGRGEGVYDPAATVTAVEAASMLMRALGYFKYQSDYADGFEVATVRQATRINLFDGVDSNTNAPLTRNQVAQMALNALKSGMVEPDGNALNFVDTNGNVIATGGKVNYVYVTSNKAFAQAISSVRATAMGSANDSPIVELGEQLYNGDLKLYDYTTDDFERPSRTWEYDGKEVGTYIKEENIKQFYTTSVGIRTLYDLLGKNSLQEYAFAYYVDGVEHVEVTADTILKRTNNDLDKTGNGVLTQVFVDTDAKTVDITAINTYLAKAAADYNKTTESVILNVYSVYDGQTRTAPKTVSLADVDNIDTIAEDEYVLVNVSGKFNNASINKTTGLTGYNVVVVDDVEILSDSTLTKYSKGNNRDNLSDHHEDLFDSVVTGGTEYKASEMAAYSDDVLELYADDRLVDKTYNIYLDNYGYAIGIDLFSGEDNYVFITGFDPSGSNITLGNAKAAAIFVDGTMSTINVNVKETNKNIDKVVNNADLLTGSNYFERWGASMDADQFALNRWYTYTVNANNEYTLNPATRMFTTQVLKADEEVIKCNAARVDENAANVTQNGLAAGQKTIRGYGNDDSVFIVVETEETADNSGVMNVINDVAGVYTGVQNVEIDVTGTVNAADRIDGTALFDSIYTLYDKNNFIIASVIVGEAKGSDANLAYILTAAKAEERLSDGTTLWTFDAVVDGTIETLTTTNKFDTISDLRPGHVQELRFMGDYVSAVKTPDNREDYYDMSKAFTKGDGITTTKGQRIDEETIYDVGHKFNADANSDCYATNTHWLDKANNLKYTDQGHLTADVANDLRVSGRTMYLSRSEGSTLGADYGLTFVQNAPAIVIQQIDGKMNQKIECASVAQAISELGDPDDTTSAKEFEGRVIAVLNGQGVAKWVIFISDTPVVTNSGTGTTTRGTVTVDLREYPWADNRFYIDNREIEEGDYTVRNSTLYVNVRAGETFTMSKRDVGDYYTVISSATGSAVSGAQNVTIPNAVDGIGRVNSTQRSVSFTMGSVSVTVPNVLYTYVAPAAHPVHVTVSNPVGGTASGPATNVQAGASVTLTVTPAANYVIDDITLNGNSIGTATTFTMPNATANVVVTFRYTGPAIPDGLPVTVQTDGVLMVNIMKGIDNLSKTAANYTLDAANVTGIETGDTLTFEPANVVEVEGVDASGKVISQTITIKVADGYSYNPIMAQWRNDETGRYLAGTRWPAVGALAVNSLPAKRFSIARTAETTEEDLHWTSGPNWFLDALEAGWTTIEFRATVTVGDQTVNAVEVLTITYYEDGTYDVVSTLGEGTTQEALNALYLAAATPDSRYP